MIPKKKVISPEQAKLRMASLCARSEQCSFDIHRKLIKIVSPADALEIIRFLREGKFIDDARFARSFTNDKVKFSAWGRRKIYAALAARKIKSSLITQALDLIDEDIYIDRATQAALSKAKSLKKDDSRFRQKIYAHLISRGFESEIASKVTRGIWEDED